MYDNYWQLFSHVATSEQRVACRRAHVAAACAATPLMQHDVACDCVAKDSAQHVDVSRAACH